MNRSKTITALYRHIFRYLRHFLNSNTACPYAGKYKKNNFDIDVDLWEGEAGLHGTIIVERKFGLVVFNLMCNFSDTEARLQFRIIEYDSLSPSGNPYGEKWVRTEDMLIKEIQTLQDVNQDYNFRYEDGVWYTWIEDQQFANFLGDGV